jgi:hypothetical protein
MKTVASILKASELAYTLSDDWNWQRRGERPLDLHIQAYQTYGDGTVQHSGAWAPQFHDIIDVCLSFTAAILADPFAEEWKLLTRSLCRTQPCFLRFALSVKYKEGVSQYYNITDMKLGKSEKLRHDKRWEEVWSACNGTPASALTILYHRKESMDWFERVDLAMRLTALAQADGWGYQPIEEVFAPLADLERLGDWRQAFEGYRRAVEAAESLDLARRLSANALENTNRSKAAPAAA